MDGLYCESWEDFEHALASLESSDLSRGGGFSFADRQILNGPWTRRWSVSGPTYHFMNTIDA
jgi:hypothetical protein